LQGLASQLAQAIENARLAAHSRQLAAAEERARLARDLHDDTIQALVALDRQLDLLALELSEPERAAERLGRVQDLLAATLEGVRRMSQNQRPAALEDLGLAAALRSHAAAWAELGLQVALHIHGQPTRLAPAIEYAVYRATSHATPASPRRGWTCRFRLTS
jgi:signal transduction histidine kinase